MQQVTNCYTHTHTHSILSLSVKQYSSLVMMFFMNVKVSLPVICHSGKIMCLCPILWHSATPQTDTSC